MRTVDFLDLLKAKNGNCSDYALRKILDLKQATISNYRHGKSFFDDAVALRVAALLELSPAYVLACIHAERAKRPQVKEQWEHIAESFRRSAAALFLSAGLIAGAAAPDTAHADSELAGNNDYTKRRKRKDGEWIRRSTAAFSTPPPQERRAAL